MLGRTRTYELESVVVEAVEQWGGAGADAVGEPLDIDGEGRRSGEQRKLGLHDTLGPVPTQLGQMGLIGGWWLG